ncbi:hypothetical protein KVV02_003864 [Mortierella alpina]|uniref:Uncharacterized protein n=1 Tax=Mortierella alpina TaxID=64518 RepID=A0A9P7ZWP5_MORAP|nr:hypothetical protein KVV02_003864 [Mortierella alpina]
MTSRNIVETLPLAAHSSSWLSDPALPWISTTNTVSVCNKVHYPCEPQAQPPTSPLTSPPRSPMSDRVPPSALSSIPQANSPITRLPVDILLYIASLRFLSLSDIVRWRSTASVFYHSISVPNAILQVAHLFQIRPRRGCLDTGDQPRAAAPLQDSQDDPQRLSTAKDLYSNYKDQQLRDIMSRLTRLLLHPAFQPRLMRSSYSFHHQEPSFSHHHHHMHHPARYGQAHHHHHPRDRFKKAKRIRRDWQDYPVFLTGNPPDLVRLAIEFGHMPFVDHLLHRGFRPRDLLGYVSMVPFLPFEADAPEKDASEHMDSQEPGKRKQRVDDRESFLKRSSLELNQIWECMRVANQELTDACARADLDGVIRVLDTTLINPRPALDSTQELYTGQKVDVKGKQRRLSLDGAHSEQGSPATESVQPDRKTAGLDQAGAGVGPPSSRKAPASHSRDDWSSFGEPDSLRENIFQPDLANSSPPAVIHRSTIFRRRQRVDSGGSQEEFRPSFGLQAAASVSTLDQHESEPHMPWIDGRALTSALLAICFRRDGFESEEAAALEEYRAVPIVTELLKYDCMLTAQSLGQAVLGVAYSRSPGSLKRAHEQRSQQQHPHPMHPGRISAPIVSVMDLLMERIGPREWLKLIKCYLQRQEFDDLAIILQRCPFKGSQIEAIEKEKGRDPRQPHRPESRGALNQQDHYRQQVRELIVREAGICGVGTRLGHFTGRGVAQASYNVSSTLYAASRILYTGSGTRFNHSYMLPRGGFRGIGGNSSGHSSSMGAEATADAAESFHGEEDDGQQGTPTAITHHPSNFALSEQQGPPLPLAHEHGGHRNMDMSAEADGDGQDEDDFGIEPEQVDAQDTNLAFGGVGSSTTSSSRPGPGIAGIAIQVQAPEHILKTLLKMGFRFFSICDLSISDARHPLALQFRQQEKMNRQMIEFSMAPNVEQVEHGRGQNEREGKTRMRSKRQEYHHDAADLERHADAVQKFLYPAAHNPTRVAVSIAGLPSLIAGYNINGGGGSNHQYTGPFTTRQRLSMVNPATPSPITASVTTARQLESTTAAMPVASHSSHSSPMACAGPPPFVLPPVQLGDSFESIAAAAASSATRQEAPSPFNLPQYQEHWFGKSTPLPILTSIDQRASLIDGRCSLESPTEGLSPAMLAQQQMLHETIKRRVREYLSSEYVDLMTVGICLYQACYHRKEVLLGVLLEHRLLIAQDALTGAVQVAASVGWKRGLDLLLMQQGDLEAEIEPVVTTTSEHVHLGTSMRWDHATASQLFPGQGGAGSGPQTMQTRCGAASAGGVEGLFSRRLRRHRSDGERLDRVSDNRPTELGVGVGGRSFEIHRRTSFDLSASPLDSADALDGSRPRPPHISGTLLAGPIIPTPRSSSLKTKLLYLLPNLSATFSSTSSADNLAGRPRRERAKHHRRQQERSQGSKHPEKIPQHTVHPPTAAPAVMMLSTSGLWSLPTVMMQRKSRNAVVALMAACTRNDPGLVQWLVESFADIQVVHIMQALMIACDLGLVRVVKALTGVPTTARHGRSEAQGKTSNPASRMLFRTWLAFQHQKILEHTLPPSTDAKLSAAPEGIQQGFHSFPFIFLMESSPLFRHFYQTLNTLSSCQFMTKRGGSSRSSSSAATSSRALGSDSALLEDKRHSSQRTQERSSNPALYPAQKRQSTRVRSPQETKLDIIRSMLAPVLELLGPISVRKALDRLPRDCWWPLDPDVRLVVDQEARKAMVAILATRKRQQREQVQKSREQQRAQEHKWRQAQQSTGLGHDQQEQCQGKADSDAVVLDNEKGPGPAPAGGAQKWHKATAQWRRVRKWMVHKRSRRRESSMAAEDAEKGAPDSSGAPSFFRRMSLSNMAM